MIQRITIAKVGGDASDVVMARLRTWAAARTSDSETLWSPDQWPAEAREQVDEFAEQVRSHSLKPPIIYFIEWVDMWSMFNVFEHWLTPPDGPVPIRLHANQYEVSGYALPDGGRLARHLAGARKQQWWETDWYIRRLREAVEAWERVVERAVLVVVRQVVGGSPSDDEVRDSLSKVPDWLSA